MLRERNIDNQAYVDTLYFPWLNNIWLIDSGRMNVIMGRSFVTATSEPFYHRVTAPLREQLLLSDSTDFTSLSNLAGIAKLFENRRGDIIEEAKTGLRSSNRFIERDNVVVPARVILIYLPTLQFFSVSSLFRELVNDFTEFFPGQLMQLDNDFNYIISLEQSLT